MSPTDDDRSRDRPEDGRDAGQEAAEREAAAWEDIVRRLSEDDPYEPGTAQHPDDAGSGPATTEQPGHAPGDDEPRDGVIGDRDPRDADPGDADVMDDGLRDSHRPDDGAGGDDPRGDDPEEDWRPPDPGDVTAGMRPGTLIAWVLLVGVGAVMIVLGFVLRGLPGWLWVPGLAIVLGCLISLFRSLPEQRNDGDDGARL